MGRPAASSCAMSARLAAEPGAAYARTRGDLSLNESARGRCYAARIRAAMGVSMNYLGCRVLAATRIGWLLAVGASVLLGSSGLTLAAAPPAYTLANVGAYGGEPSIASDSL